MNTENDDEISQSLNIILNAKKYGPMKLCAVIANVIKQSMQQRNKIQW